MDRRNFLRLIGWGTAAVIATPADLFKPWSVKPVVTDLPFYEMDITQAFVDRLKENLLMENPLFRRLKEKSEAKA